MSIIERALSSADLRKIQDAAILLSQISGLELLDHLEDILIKLGEKKDFKTQELKKIVAFQNDYWVNTNFFIELFRAIREKQVLEVTYDSYNQGTSTYTFHPYFLKHYNEMWYVFGYSDEERIYNKDFALDKIIKLELSKKQFKENNDSRCDFENSYFSDIVGISKDFMVEKVKIRLRVNENSVRVHKQ
jgi:predicted DNA-binding transcriptional regulator YafY